MEFWSVLYIIMQLIIIVNQIKYIKANYMEQRCIQFLEQQHRSRGDLYLFLLIGGYQLIVYILLVRIDPWHQETIKTLVLIIITTLVYIISWLLTKKAKVTISCDKICIPFNTYSRESLYYKIVQKDSGKEMMVKLYIKQNNSIDLFDLLVPERCSNQVEEMLIDNYREYTLPD